MRKLQASETWEKLRVVEANGKKTIVTIVILLAVKYFLWGYWFYFSHPVCCGTITFCLLNAPFVLVWAALLLATPCLFRSKNDRWGILFLFSFFTGENGRTERFAAAQAAAYDLHLWRYDGTVYAVSIAIVISSSWCFPISLHYNNYIERFDLFI